tara:strand:- start:136 stop:753 length:618 start_codon:yes stop_codon:yes gene_type:complete
VKKNYTCVKDDSFKSKKLNSKFYSFIYSISSYEDIKKKLNFLKIKHSDASHICYAYRLFNGFTLLNEINTNDFSTDAGEPRGSSGPPILKILKRHNMVNVVVFVVRYFGGTKLGIPGLIEAYSESTEGLIKKENIKLWFPTKIVELEYPYNIEKPLSNLFKKFNVKINSRNYYNSIHCVIELNIIDIDTFLNALTSFPSCSIKKT